LYKANTRIKENKTNAKMRGEQSDDIIIAFEGSENVLVSHRSSFKFKPIAVPRT
jgi:hypothetical protein